MSDARTIPCLGTHIRAQVHGRIEFRLGKAVEPWQRRFLYRDILTDHLGRHAGLA